MVLEKQFCLKLSSICYQRQPSFGSDRIPAQHIRIVLYGRTYHRNRVGDTVWFESSEVSGMKGAPLSSLNYFLETGHYYPPCVFV